MRNFMFEGPARRFAVIALIFAALSLFVEAKAQSCAQYPPGPQRFTCASQLHPGLVAKQQRCQEEARRMGLSTRGGAGGRGGGLQEYVVACMRRH